MRIHEHIYWRERKRDLKAGNGPWSWASGHRYTVVWCYVIVSARGVRWASHAGIRNRAASSLELASLPARVTANLGAFDL